MIETAHKLSGASAVTTKSKTVTIRPSSLKTAASSNRSQQIIVIPQNMLVNGCISVDGLKKIIDNDIKTTEHRGSLKRPASASSVAEDSTYGSDSEGSEHNLDKPARKRANLDHLSPEEKLMRRKLKNRVAAQNARDKKRMKMEEMEAELMRLKNHAKALENKNAELVCENQRLVVENDELRSCESRVNGQETSSPLVAGQPPESAAGTGLSSIGRWAIGLDSLPDNGLKVVVERAEGQQTPEEVTVKEEVADVMTADIIKHEDFTEDTEACEEMLDKFLEMTSAENDNGTHNHTILDTAWEDTFGELFPDLGECTF